MITDLTEYNIALRARFRYSKANIRCSKQASLSGKGSRTSPFRTAHTRSTALNHGLFILSNAEYIQELF